MNEVLALPERRPIPSKYQQLHYRFLRSNPKEVVFACFGRKTSSMRSTFHNQLVTRYPRPNSDHRVSTCY
ncbi:hypothetical protein Hanom_Chr07g00679571 [Helianthus anomalus]